MIFLGVLFPKERETELLQNSRSGISNAANQFQWNLLNGLADNLGEGIRVINVLPVGTYPRKYKKLILSDSEWMNRGTTCQEIGCVNLPLIKQAARFWGVRKALQSCAVDEEIMLCTAYLPFLMAVAKLSETVKVTAIITDIPEYYDMHQVSRLRAWIRKLHNKIVYHYLERVDRFVLLTEQMAQPLHVGSRPYCVVEGMCSMQSSGPESEEKTPKFTMLYAGRLNCRYGLKTLLDAVSRIDNENLELWICGTGDMEDEVQRWSNEDHRICYFGFQPHEVVLKMQRAASLLVNPRTSEGEYTKYSFPSKTIEYMASGTPVLMYKLPGVPAEYDPYLIYIEELGVDGLKAAIEKATAMKPTELCLCGAKAMKFVQEQKNCVAQTKKILELIRSGK